MGEYNTKKKKEEPLVAGVEYFSGREAGGGQRLRFGKGRPEEISGFTTTTSPVSYVNVSGGEAIEFMEDSRNFFQKPFGLR